jgi:hypothetical protein
MLNGMVKCFKLMGMKNENVLLKCFIKLMGMKNEKCFILHPLISSDVLFNILPASTRGEELIPFQFDNRRMFWRAQVAFQQKSFAAGPPECPP